MRPMSAREVNYFNVGYPTTRLGAETNDNQDERAPEGDCRSEGVARSKAVFFRRRVFDPVWRLGRTESSF